MSRHDVVVVGAGMAGLTAAVRLAEGGATVLVLAKGVGATHLSPATIDVLGYAPDRVDRPLEALAAFAERHPGHPYGVVGAAGVAAAVPWFAERFADGPLAPYAYTGTADENLLLPTAVGVLRPSAVVPETMAGGDLRDGGEVCVVGFRALKDFHPRLAADNLSRHPGVTARGIELDCVPEGRVDVNALGFARAFDDAAFRKDVVARVAGRLHAEERVAFPAVLGIADPHAVWSELQDRLGRPVFEIPTLPPSVPGMRVFATLRERLRRAGSRVVLNNVVTGAEHRGGTVTGVRARVGLRDVVHGADWVVLATGGFASGGVELDSRWAGREVALGLPVAGIPAPGEERFGPAYFGEHPMARAGVAVDADQRPVGADGARVFDNVLVAGATLAGAEPWREKSGEGISLATGHRAAGLILDAAGSAQRSAVAATEG
ncbi:MAG: glycerol-3-phosphate dehydrogenase subunit GlpB [Solirubrobacterales bacterium]|nr:glycerol-3-phosphate dehydrogenase subunit GlpB [Solirubrobacterales bacterium]